MIEQTYRRREQGVTSLIVVLFTILLFVVVAVGFMQTMTVEQRASADDELSRGAYDSALAGVEDGKRVLQACLIDGDANVCSQIKDSCTTVSDAGFVTPESNGEVVIKSNTSSGLTGRTYQQAYTCVKISPYTKDFIGTAAADESVIVPLRMTAPINKVIISWFSSVNSTDKTNVTLDPPLDTQVSLPAKGTWSPSKPSIMRVQLIQFANGKLSLDDFDKNGNGHTLYLYPKRVGAIADFANDARRRGDLAPTIANCVSTFLSTYACSAEITLPNPVGGNASDRVAYLRLTSLYNSADFSVAPADGTVKFNALQPAIDSTGRAADVYRRVQARIELSDPNDMMLYPRATVDTTSDLCNGFVVTDSLDDYQPCS